VFLKIILYFFEALEMKKNDQKNGAFSHSEMPLAFLKCAW